MLRVSVPQLSCMGADNENVYYVHPAAHPRVIAVWESAEGETDGV